MIDFNMQYWGNRGDNFSMFFITADNPEMFGLIYFSSAQNKDTLTTYKLIGGANKEQWIKEIVKCLSETKCTADSVRK